MLHRFTFISDVPHGKLLEGIIVSDDVYPGEIAIHIENYKIGLVPQVRDGKRIWCFSNTPIDIRKIQRDSDLDFFEVSTTKECAVAQKYRSRLGYNHPWGISGDVLEGCTVEELVQTCKPAAYKNCMSSSTIALPVDRYWYIENAKLYISQV